MLDWLEWRSLLPDECGRLAFNEKLILRVPLAGGVSVDTRLAELSFHERFKLGWVRVSKGNDLTSSTIDLMFLFDEERFLILDGTSSPIHDANAFDTLNLTRKTVVDYVRFFCSFVYGDTGPFPLLESRPQACVGNEPIHPKCPELARNIQPAKFVEKTVSGAFRVSAIALYDNSAFEATFEVTPGGEIEMIDANPLVEEVPKELQPPLPALYQGRNWSDLDSLLTVIGEPRRPLIVSRTLH